MPRNESYENYISRLFPEERGEIKIGGNFVRNITFQVTENCNMACTYCYQHDKTPKMMTFETGKDFIDMLLDSDEKSAPYIQSKTCPGVVIEFIGGEPFLAIDVIDKLTDYFIEQCIIRKHPWATRYRISICTNGLLYFDERVQNYIKRHNEHLSLSITLDGNKELHDSCRIDTNGNPTYDRVIEAINHYREHYGSMAGSKATLAPGNINVTSKAIISMIENGYDTINVNCVYEEGWTDEHASILYIELKKVADYLLENNLENKIYISILDNPSGQAWNPNDHNTWCGGNGLMIAVAPDGYIYPCLRYTPSSLGNKQKPYIIGSIKDGFMSTKEEQERVNCFKCITRQSQCKGTDCENCPISTGCGDCSAYSYEITGNVGSRTTYHCNMHKARVLACAYYQNKKYIKNKSNERYPLNIPDDWALQIVEEQELNMLKELSK